MEFAKRIKALRERLGLTQMEFAEKIGISQPSVTMYESGLREPSWEAVQKIVTGLGIQYDELADKPARRNGRRSRQV